MKSGDHIELLHSKQKGIIRRIINSRIAEIETEDGFIMPVSRDEIVVLYSPAENPSPEAPSRPAAEKPFVIDPQAIVERIFDNTDRRNELYAGRSQRIGPPEDEVDLHIERLTDDYRNMDNNEMIRLQLEVFEKKLDQAIASGKHDITFIHGVGTGVLRQAIHRVLSQLLKQNRISAFQDGRPFSSIAGCTYIKIG